MSDIKLSAIANIFDLGRALHEYQYCDDLKCFSFSLSDEELSKFNNNLGEAAAEVLDAVSEIGALLAYVDVLDLGQESINRLGFAISALTPRSRRTYAAGI